MPVWGSTYDSYLAPLITLQKRAVRLIHGASRNDHSDPLFRSLKLLKFHQLYVYSVQLFIFKYCNNELPIVFNGFFEQNHMYHDYNTRHNSLFRTPRIYSMPLSRSVRFRGVHISNYFSQYLTTNCSYVTYKYTLKNHILNHEITYASCR